MGTATKKSADEVHGYEYDWLASDADGLVALFTTAGVGHAPSEFLLDTDAHDAAIDIIVACPASTAVRFAPNVAPGRANLWEMVAERGLFAYDCDTSSGVYRMVAAPVTPLVVASLPAPAASVVSKLRLALRFGEREVVTNEMLTRRE